MDFKYVRIQGLELAENTMYAKGIFSMCMQLIQNDVMEKEDHYTTQYPLRESPLKNIRDIREMGMAAFLARERDQWRCDECGSPICVHDGMCCGCGKYHGKPVG